MTTIDIIPESTLVGLVEVRGGREDGRRLIALEYDERGVSKRFLMTRRAAQELADTITEILIDYPE